MALNQTKYEEYIYFNQLDGLRFVAVFAVMFGHWMRFPNLKIFNSFLGSGGVNLFFVLSGFLISRILIQNKINNNRESRNHWNSIKQFYARRALRIFPIYFLLIFVTVIFNYKPARELFWWLVTYTTNIYWSWNDKLGHFTHLWSLAVEEQFYLIFPFIILFISSKYLLRSLYIIVLIALVTRVLFHFIHPNGRETYALMIACLDSFGIGGLLAYWFIFDKAKLKSILDRKWVFVFSLLLFLCCCGTLYFYQDGNLIFRLFNRLSYSICCFWIIGVSCLQGFRGFFKLFLENKIVAYLGKISYGLYLYHNFVPSLSEFILKVLHIPVSLTERPIYESALIYFFITIVLSIISWHLIEKPFISLKKYFEYQFITIT